ncbi:MAG: aldo/keto reductase [Methylacidiphilales bacterium]|nr:aldo/keto reductase [Candidatus Methylacidiphilales bacterium]
MKTIPLGSTDLKVSRLCYGAMRIAGTWDRNKVDTAAIEKGIRSLESAVEAGYTFIDHADIYGDTTCEMIHGRALDRHPDWREKLVVATKCGIRFDDEPPGTPHRYDFSGEHIRWSVDESLKRLNLERIDLYQLHRPDWLADPEDIAQALVDLHKAGKVRYFGVSNFRPTLVSALQSALPFPLVSNQVQIHFLRLDCFEDGTLDQCLEKKMSPLAWSPLAGGRLAAALSDKAPLPENQADVAAAARLRPVLADTAQAYNTTPLAILLAWLMRHPSKIIPILGSVRPEVIRESVKADEIDLDRDSWYRILFAARGKRLE